MSEPSLDEIRAIKPSEPILSTALTKFFRIQHPVILAGMNQAAGPELAAAVSNAGGIGVIGGVNYSAKMLRGVCQDLKAGLREPNLPWGVDLLLPQVGGNARKTNKDYTKGSLDDLIDVIIEEGATMFVSAVGVPPKSVVERLHRAGILVANMVGHPKHVRKALEIGIDMIIAQAGEAGGHTGDVPFSILIPKVVELTRHSRSRLTGQPVMVVAAGGIYDGRGLAASLVHGACAVWVGTRFVASVESGAPQAHKEAIVKAREESIVKTVIFTGRPLHIVNSPYIQSWLERPDLIKKLCDDGVVPVEWDLAQGDDDEGTKVKGVLAHYFAGKVAAAINDILPAKTIVDTMVADAARSLRSGASLITSDNCKL
jgi:NAD(P)H-dependent flavin oxidoreductase YrpB (nitropropane dioxygenase family)